MAAGLQSVRSRSWLVEGATLALSAAFVLSVYVAVQIGLRLLVGAGSRANLIMAVVATGLVAVAFQPVRDRVRSLANQAVFGNRADPYQVLAEFSARLGGLQQGKELLPSMARQLAEATGAVRAEVWMRSGAYLFQVAGWPAGDGSEKKLRLVGDRLPAPAPFVRSVEIRHLGELLGALFVQVADGDELRPMEEKLIGDLAAQSGLLLHSLRLDHELGIRLEQITHQAVRLRGLRRNVVTAHDAERRRLERDIHDGAQQNLIALAVRLRVAAISAAEEPARALAIVKELRVEIEQARATLAQLARGLRPRLLSEHGLGPALREHARSLDVPLYITARNPRRLQPEVEAAIYFCCIEALQNAAKHARASRVDVHFETEDRAFVFRIRDDGVGFDPANQAGGSGLQNLAERLAAVGGRVQVESCPGEGTTVTGRVDLARPSPA